MMDGPRGSVPENRVVPIRVGDGGIAGGGGPDHRRSHARAAKLVSTIASFAIFALYIWYLYSMTHRDSALRAKALHHLTRALHRVAYAAGKGAIAAESAYHRSL